MLGSRASVISAHKLCYFEGNVIFRCTAFLCVACVLSGPANSTAALLKCRRETRCFYLRGSVTVTAGVWAFIVKTPKRLWRPVRPPADKDLKALKQRPLRCEVDRSTST